MEKYTFYIRVDADNDVVMTNTADLLEALHQNYGVTYEAVVRVETDKVFLIPMLEELSQANVTVEEKVAAQEKVAKSKPVIEADVVYPLIGKICPECGNLFDRGGIKGFCSKKCYNVDYRKTHKAEKKDYKTSVENQDAAARNRTTEEERIEAVVANAKMTAPSATGEHTVRNPDGPIMALKL